MGHNLINETLKLAGIRSPAILNNVAAFTNAVEMSRFKKIIAVLTLGDMAAETIDFRLESGNTLLSGNLSGTITTRLASAQLAANAGANDNKQVILELDNMQIGGDGFVQARAITSGATGGIASIHIFGVPFSTLQPHVASVLEVKNG